MARSFGSQTPAQRRAAQRRTAKELREGKSPLGGRFRKIVRAATVRGNKRRAYENIRQQLGTYLKYDDDRVRHYVYEVMTEEDLIWTQEATADELTERARQGQNMGDPWVIEHQGDPVNVWWYH